MREVHEENQVLGMERIPAGNNLTIESGPDVWRLLVNGNGHERVVAEASAGQPLRYMPTFGSRRKLPDTGALPVQYIQRVVLGYSEKDAAWHLGLLLEAELAEARGSRWCEMASWMDPTTTQYKASATQAGERLAQTLARPFVLIPPERDTKAQPASGYYAPAAVPITPEALPKLPLTLDLWTLNRTAQGQLVFRLAGSWARGKVLRALWYLFWSVIYVVLSVTTLRAEIALPKPEFLPYLGLASAAVLVLLALYNLGRVLTIVNRIVVDPARRVVVGLHNGSEKWRVAGDEIEAVYVSQVMSRKGRGNKRTSNYNELNLLLRSGEFRHLLSSGQTEEKDAIFDETPLEDGVYPLTPALLKTSSQGAAGHVALALGVEGRYDQRLK